MNETEAELGPRHDKLAKNGGRQAAGGTFAAHCLISAHGAGRLVRDVRAIEPGLQTH
jgi:hypothetical protein